MNQVTLIGRLGQDPEIKGHGDGAVCSCSLATKEREKRDGQWVEGVQWHRFVVFGRTAENLVAHKRKGDEVAVSGSYRSRKYTAKDGNEKEAWEVRADRVEYVGGRSDGGGRSEGGRDDRPAPRSSRAPAPVPDDIPF